MRGGVALVAAWLRQHPFTPALLLVMLVTSVAQIVITSPPETFEARCYLPQLTLRQAARMAATLGRDRARD